MQNLRKDIESQIRKNGTGWVFTRKDLRNIAPSAQIGVILCRLEKEGIIRRIARGLYDYPEKSDLLNENLPPSPDLAAQAISRKHRWIITPDEAMAANILNLSQQVPAKIVYLSTGPTRCFNIGNQIITFRHTAPRNLHMEHYSSRIIAQALRFLGKKKIDSKTLKYLRSKLTDKEKTDFLGDVQFGTDWILDIAEKLIRNDRE